MDLRGTREIDKIERYQSKTICENKNVSYEAHLCPIFVKAQRAPNAQATLQIVDRHYEELNPFLPRVSFGCHFCVLCT